MNLEWCSEHDFKLWPKEDRVMYDTKLGEVMFNQYKFMKWMDTWQGIREDLWVEGVDLKDFSPYAGNTILCELHRDFVVIPGDVRDQVAYIGLLRYSQVKRFRFLHAPNKNNIVFHLDRLAVEQSCIDKEVLCMIKHLGELHRIMQVLVFLWKRGSGITTFSDLNLRILQSVYQMSIKHSSLSRLISIRYGNISERIASHS